MKCSDYLWEFCKVVEEMEGQPVAQAKGEVNKRMGYPTFLSDTTGKVMSERDVYSVLGRNEKELWDAYDAGDKDKFAGICVAQLTRDDGYHGAKEAEA